MEGCKIFWVTPLPAFVHSLSYDLFLPSNQFAFNFFLQRGQLVHQKYEIKKKNMLLVEKQKPIYWLWHLNNKNSHVAGMCTRIRLASRANVMRSTRCAVRYRGNHPGRLWYANDDLKQSWTLIIGFGIFHYGRNIGYGVLSSFTTIISEVSFCFRLT